MILTLAECHENLHRGSPLSLLSMVKFVSCLETMMILKIPNETILRITRYLVELKIFFIVLGGEDISVTSYARNGTKKTCSDKWMLTSNKWNHLPLRRQNMTRHLPNLTTRIKIEKEKRRGKKSKKAIQRSRKEKISRFQRNLVFMMSKGRSRFTRRFEQTKEGVLIRLRSTAPPIQYLRRFWKLDKKIFKPVWIQNFNNLFLK